jgi:hypothetical protein
MLKTNTPKVLPNIKKTFSLEKFQRRESIFFTTEVKQKN